MNLLISCPHLFIFYLMVHSFALHFFIRHDYFQYFLLSSPDCYSHFNSPIHFAGKNYASDPEQRSC